MKDFARRSARLAGLSFHAKLVYSVFLGFTLAGLALTWVLSQALVGNDYSEVSAYYAGQSTVANIEGQEALLPDEGPAFDLPAEAEQIGQEAEPMAVRKLLEVTHFHLFSIPVYLLILGHIYMLSSAGNRAKTAWIGIATLATAAHLVAPWMARSFAGNGSTWFYAISGGGLFVSYLVMCLRPLIDMWWQPRRTTSGSNA